MRTVLLASVVGLALGAPDLGMDEPRGPYHVVSGDTPWRGGALSERLAARDAESAATLGEAAYPGTLADTQTELRERRGEPPARTLADEWVTGRPQKVRKAPRKAPADAPATEAPPPPEAPAARKQDEELMQALAQATSAMAVMADQASTQLGSGQGLLGRVGMPLAGVAPAYPPPYAYGPAYGQYGTPVVEPVPRVSPAAVAPAGAAPPVAVPTGVAPTVSAPVVAPAVVSPPVVTPLGGLRGTPAVAPAYTPYGAVAPYVPTMPLGVPFGLPRVATTAASGQHMLSGLANNMRARVWAPVHREVPLF